MAPKIHKNNKNNMSKTDSRNTELYYWQAFHRVANEKSREGAIGIWINYLHNKFSNPDKLEKHLDFLLNKGIPAISAVETTGDPLVDNSKHITITYKVTDGIKPTPQSDDGIHGQSSVPGIECREKMGKVNTCDK